MTIVESQAPWLGKMPLDWGSTRIRNVADLSPGSSNGHPERSELCTIVPMEKLSDKGLIDISNQQLFEDVQAGLAMFEEGDVLFAKITPCMENGKGAFVDQLPTKCAFGSTEFHVLRPRREVNGRFLYYATFNPVFRAYAAENMTGAAGQKRVSSRFFKDTRLYLPRMLEQKLIAAYLDASCGAIDGAVTAKRSQFGTLEALLKAFIQRVVICGIDESMALKPTGNLWMEHLPAGWKLSALKRVSMLQTGLTLGKQYEGTLIERPYLRVANVQEGHLSLEDVKTIELPKSVVKRVELRPNDVLMTEGGDLDKLGRGYLWEGQISGCLHQNHIFAVRCTPHLLLPKFLTYVTASKYGRDYFEATGKRTTNLASTNATKVRAFPIPLPPLAEQKRLVAFLDDRLQEFGQIRKSINKQIQSLLGYRKALIYECVTGKRRITEADVARVQDKAPEEWGRKQP